MTAHPAIFGTEWGQTMGSHCKAVCVLESIARDDAQYAGWVEDILGKGGRLKEEKPKGGENWSSESGQEKPDASDHTHIFSRPKKSFVHSCASR